MRRGGTGKGSEIAPPSRGPELSGGSREALLQTGSPSPGLAQGGRHTPCRVLGDGRRGSRGARDALHPRQGPAPSFPRQLPRPPAARSPTQPGSALPRACARSPRPSPAAAAGARAVPVVPGGSWRPRGRLRAREQAPGARPGEAGARARAWAAGGGRSRATAPPVGWPGRGATREGRAPGAGGHGREPEAAAAAAVAAVGPAGGEARGLRPLTVPSGLARPRAPWGAVAKQRPARPPIPRCPFFSWPGAREHARAWPQPAKS